MGRESIFHEGELKVQELAGDVRPCDLKPEATKSQYLYGVQAATAARGLGQE